MILLDTHSAIWFAEDNSALGPRGKEAALDALEHHRLLISAVSFWEIALLASRNRIGIKIPAGELRERLLASGIREIALSGDIAVKSVELTGLPADPADRFIVASALIQDAALLTADRKLLRWRSSLVRLDARK